MSCKLVFARLLAALACCLLAGDSGRASASQDGDRKRYAETEEELDALLWERDRELLHRGAPLDVSGLEHGDNTFRVGTPALARTNASAAQVDLETLHRRKLAMYSERAAFHTPLPLGAPAPLGSGARSGTTGGAPDAGSATAGSATAGSATAGSATDGGAASDSLSISGVLGLVTLVMLFIVAWRARQVLS